jgi:hypothetical protein
VHRNAPNALPANIQTLEHQHAPIVMQEPTLKLLVHPHATHALLESTQTLVHRNAPNALPANIQTLDLQHAPIVKLESTLQNLDRPLVPNVI